MSGDVTYQALERLTHMPDESGNQGDVIAGQKYYDIEFTGGAISDVTLTDVTINGVTTARNERVIIASGGVTVESDDYVITMNKTVPATTAITLPASPAISRSLIFKDGAGNAATYNITIDGNGKTIDGQSSLVVDSDWGSFELIYNGAEWNAIGSYDSRIVVGPSTSTPNAIVRYNGSSGALLKDSDVIIDDTDNITGLTTITIPNTGLHILDTNASHDLIIVPGSDLTADRTFTIITGDASRSLTLAGNATISNTNTGDVTLAGENYLSITNQVLTAAAVDLSGTNVKGNLPVTHLNSGTSASSTTYWGGDGKWSTPAGSGVTSVSGTTNRITSTGGNTPVIDISSSYAGQNTIVTTGTLTTGATGAGFTVALGTSTITGALGLTNGGTGQITANASLNALLPSQATNSGKFLTTDGTNSSWAAVAGSGTVTSVSVVSANGFAGSVATSTTTPAITVSTSISGVLLGNGTAISASNVTNDAQTKAAIVPNTAPSAGQILAGNAGGTAYGPVSVSGAITLASTGAATIATPGTLTVSSTNSTVTAHTHAITSSSAPGAAASILATDSSGIIGSTGTRIVKGWFTDLTVTNAIAGSVTTNANLTGPITSVGNATSIASQTGTGTKFVVDTSPTLVTPLLGTPTSGVLTNCTGTATGLTSGITNALKSATTTVSVSSATAPSSGQVLTATSSTAATWQTLSGLPTQVTGSMSAVSTADFTVDFTTYSAYLIMIDNAIGSTSTQLRVDVSQDAGSTVATATRQSKRCATATWTAVSTYDVQFDANNAHSLCVGTITQNVSTGGSSFTGFGRDDGSGINTYAAASYATTLAINRVRLSCVSGTVTCNIVLQPISKR